MPTPAPLDPLVRGVLIVLVLIIVGAMLLSGGIEVGCFYEKQTLCEKGGGIKDILSEVVALIALLLGLRKTPPNE